MPSESDNSGSPPRMTRLLRRSAWLLAGLVVLVAAVLGVEAWLMRQLEPELRAGILAELEHHFHGKVELGSFRTTLREGLEVEGGGLRIWLPGLASGEDGSAAWFQQPWITVDRFHFHANWRMHPGDPVEIAVVRVEGVRILVPPSVDRPHLSAGTAAQTPGTTQGMGESASGLARSTLAGLLQPPKIVVRRIECADVDLVIERGLAAGKPRAGIPAAGASPTQTRPPLDFALRDLALTPDSNGGPTAFAVDMINPRPVGTVHAVGKVGPWKAAEATGRFSPADLPVSGDFTFSKADLSSIRGISGHLEATGKFDGLLHRIAVAGRSQCPDFRLERADTVPGVELDTNFRAVVDGTNGNVALEQVEAMLGHSHLNAHGLVERAVDAGTGTKGHDIALEVTVDRGRVEDFLHVSTAEQPLMTGNLTLTTHFHLRPNSGAETLPVLERLELEGQAQADGVHFTSDKIQETVKQISLRGLGQPGQVKATDAATIEAALTSHFTLAGGELTVPDLVARVPGAEIDVHGSYELAAGTLNFDGDARMQAPLSKMVGGWKGLLLKPADRFLRKNGAATDVPVHLTGTRGAPKFGVDWDRIGK